MDNTRFFLFSYHGHPIYIRNSAVVAVTHQNGATVVHLGGDCAHCVDESVEEVVSAISGLLLASNQKEGVV